MSERVLEQGDRELQQLFERYRAACPEPEASADFMPQVWSRIESRRTFSFTFWKLGRSMAAVSAVLCLLLFALNLMFTPKLPVSYPDALISDFTAEQTYYTEAIRPATPPPAEAAH